MICLIGGFVLTSSDYDRSIILYYGDYYVERSLMSLLVELIISCGFLLLSVKVGSLSIAKSEEILSKDVLWPELYSVEKSSS